MFSYSSSFSPWSNSFMVIINVYSSFGGKGVEQLNLIKKKLYIIYKNRKNIKISILMPDFMQKKKKNILSQLSNVGSIKKEIISLLIVFFSFVFKFPMMINCGEQYFLCLCLQRVELSHLSVIKTIILSYQKMIE